jgi:succinate dehydrogenase/fumarate reductase flavoprotein subunit
VQTIQTDVLVIGGGAAGARAALEARLAGVHVTLAVKGRFGGVGVRGAGASATALDGAGGVLFTGDADVPPTAQQAYDEAMQLGLGLADPKLVRVLVEGSLRNRSELASLNIYPRHGFGRGINCHGVPLVVGLAGHVCSRGIDVRESVMIAHLLVRDGECVGAVGIVEASGEIFAIQAASVILATGGDGQAFKHNLNPACVTADGYAMGFDAGAELMNLEFKQVFVMSVYPTRNILHLWTWKHPVKLVNAHGEEFLAKYCPPGIAPEMVLEQHAQHDPASTRDAYSRFLEAAIIGEVSAGNGTPHGGVWLDMRGQEHLLDPNVAEWLRYRGIFSNDELVEMSVCHQCSNGGFRVDENAQTTIRGLYALGECMAGAYGADRRGGHMLASTQVFGARAGRHAARRARTIARQTFDQQLTHDAADEIARLEKSRGTQSPQELKRALQESNWRDLLFVRTVDGLARGLAQVEQIRTEFAARLRVETPRDLVEVIELRNLLTATEMVARAALLRQETRGAHYRPDFPSRNDAEWRKCITIKKVNDAMCADTLVIDPDWQDRANNVVSSRWG